MDTGHPSAMLIGRWLMNGNGSQTSDVPVRTTTTGSAPQRRWQRKATSDVCDVGRGLHSMAKTWLMMMMKYEGFSECKQFKV